MTNPFTSAQVEAMQDALRRITDNAGCKLKVEGPCEFCDANEKRLEALHARLFPAAGAPVAALRAVQADPCFQALESATRDAVYECCAAAERAKEPTDGR